MKGENVNFITKKEALDELGLCYCHPSEKPAQTEHNEKLVNSIFGENEELERFVYDDLCEINFNLISTTFE